MKHRDNLGAVQERQQVRLVDLEVARLDPGGLALACDVDEPVVCVPRNRALGLR